MVKVASLAAVGEVPEGAVIVSPESGLVRAAATTIDPGLVVPLAEMVNSTSTGLVVFVVPGPIFTFCGDW